MTGSFGRMMCRASVGRGPGFLYVSGFVGLSLFALPALFAGGCKFETPARAGRGGGGFGLSCGPDEVGMGRCGLNGGARVGVAVVGASCPVVFIAARNDPCCRSFWRATAPD